MCPSTQDNNMNNYFLISLKNLTKWAIKGTCSYLLWSMAAMLIFCAGCVTQNTPSFNYAPDDQKKVAQDTNVPAGKSLIFVFVREAPHTPRFLKLAQTTLQVDQRDVCRLATTRFTGWSSIPAAINLRSALLETGPMRAWTQNPFG